MYKAKMIKYKLDFLEEVFWATLGGTQALTSS